MLLQILVGGLVVFIIFFSCFGQSERAICRAMTIRSQETERTEISHDRPASSHKKGWGLAHPFAYRSTGCVSVAVIPRRLSRKSCSISSRLFPFVSVTLKKTNRKAAIPMAA